MQKTVEKHRVECDREMRQVRVKHGLPAQRYKAEGYFKSDGTWVETRPAEVTLDVLSPSRAGAQLANQRKVRVRSALMMDPLAADPALFRYSRPIGTGV